MFETLTDQLTKTLQHLTGRGRLTEENIQDTLRQVRIALLQADVSLPVVKSFIEDTKTKAIGQEITHNLRPGEFLTKLIYDNLVILMGERCETLNLRTQPPAVILMAGLQGSGKTTTAGKLGYWLQKHDKKSVMVVSTDIYRPAAIDQLKTIAAQAGIQYFPSTKDQSPIDIAKAAHQKACIERADILIVDTAGRLHVDADMMKEIQALHTAINPIETLFVVDSMTGQDATNTAKAFNDALPLTGVILTKTDGDARGGAALSIRQITQKPIKFMGVGEKIDALEAFHPDRIASRILGMGDILTLVEEAAHKVDQKKAEKLAKKLKKGKTFDLEDFLAQLQQMRNMGGVKKLLENLPGMTQLPQAMKNAINDEMFTRMEAMINSMTPEERQFPDLIKASRKRRITAGSGTKIEDLNRLLKQFKQMQKMMKRFSGAKMKQMLSMLQGRFPQ